MKYKNIKAMSHNWSHSFVGGVNYVDGDFIFNDLKNLMMKHPEKTLHVFWIPSDKIDLSFLTPRIKKSIGYYLENLDAHLQNHQIDKAMLEELRTDISLDKFGLYTEAYAKDNRGKEYKQHVK
jgi:hypothetical protein